MFNKIERTKSGKLCDASASHGRGYEQKRDLLHCLLQELQCAGSSPTWAWILGNNHIIRVRSKLLCALRQIQNYKGINSELRPLELFYAIVYDVGIPVNEKNAEGPAPVRSGSLYTKTPLVIQVLVLCQSGH